MTRSRGRVGPLAVAGSPAPDLDVDALIDDPGTGIIVCCGSGGVGKTTTAAALALRAAERGRTVVVLTIDPARRLAQSMGIEALDNTPRPVVGVDPANGGSLDAMMLDMKRTFDEVVESQATPEKARQILENPFYVALSSSFSGTQEYMAMEKLGQIHRRRPARRHLRPDRRRHAAVTLGAGLPRRARAALELPRRQVHPAAARAGAWPGPVDDRRARADHERADQILGAQVLRDMQTFVAAFDTLFGGFRQRAQKTFALLQADGTSFLVVAAPEPDALREAQYFVERLSEDRMPLGGLIVNRASPQPSREPGRGRGDGRGHATAQHRSRLTDSRVAPAARRPRADGRAGVPAACAIRCRSPGGGHAGRASTRGRCARPGRPTPDR